MSTEEADTEFNPWKASFATKRWRTLSILAAAIAALLAGSQFTSVPSEVGWAFAIGIYIATFCWRMDMKPREENDA